MNSIIIEIAYFFKKFADFMEVIIEDAETQSSLIKKAIEKDSLQDYFIQRINIKTNTFFVTQTAEWHAVQIVSSKFVDNFRDGWSKLNKLNGNFLTGNELKNYLREASEKIELISLKQQRQSDTNIESLDEYRRILENKF